MNPFGKNKIAVIAGAFTSALAAAAVREPRAPRLGKAKAHQRPAPRPIDDLPLPAGPQVLGRVVCPWPPVALSPNARGHWSKRSRAAKAYRHECWALALAAGLHLLDLRSDDDGERFLFMQLDFFPPDQRVRDDDNAIASFKAGRDGIADAMKVDDSRFVTSHRCHPEARACVVVTVLRGPAPVGGAA